MNKTAKKLALWTIIIAGVFLLQSVISTELIKVNLTLLLVYYFGLKKGELQGVSFGISIGFLEDTLSGQLIGPGMLGKDWQVSSLHISRMAFLYGLPCWECLRSLP